LLASAVPPDGWAATPDGVAPVDGPRPLFTAFYRTDAVLQFAAPGTGHAALVGDWMGTHRWLRYDLRKPPHPVAEVTLARGSYGRAEPGSCSVLDLSPDGQWLAGALGTRFVSLWDTNGDPVGRFYPGADNDKEQDIKVSTSNYTWVGFTAAAHLALLRGDKQIDVRDAPAGAIASTTAVEIEEPATLSPGRKWLVGYTADGFQWLSVPGWKPAGTLRLPARLPAQSARPGIAISADGTRFAAYFPSSDAPLLLTWDVQTGALQDVVALPPETRRGQIRELPPRVQWTGPRTVLVAGNDLVDLDIGTTVYKSWCMNTRGAPDDRAWQIGAGPDDGQGKRDRDRLLEVAMGMADPAAAPKWENTVAFFAGPHPFPALAARLDAFRRKPMFDRNHPVRAEAAGGPAEFRDKAAAELAKFLQSRGYTTDPTAPVAIRVVVDSPTTEQRLMGGNAVWVRGGIATPAGVHKPFVVINGNLMVRGSDGRVIWTAPVGNGASGIDAKNMSAFDLERADPDAVARAREDFLKQFQAVALGAVLRNWGPVGFSRNGPVYLPLQGRGLALEGVLDGGLAEPRR
jgi:hypothetical protein